MNPLKDERVDLAKERTLLANERTRLANERTFLAWVRTGLATVGGGVLVMKLLTFEHAQHKMIAQWVGGFLILLGIVIFSISWIDYRQSTKKLYFKSAEENRIFPFTFITLGLVVSSIFLLIILLNFF